MDERTDRPRESDCVFCKIAAGELPAQKVYETDDVLAFLDIEPLSPGHTVIIPREHWATLDEVPPETAAAVGRCLPLLSRAVMEAVGQAGGMEGQPGAWNVLQNNGRAAHQAVGHVHFHIIPKPTDQREAGLGVSWPAKKLDADEGRRLAQAIRTRTNSSERV